MPKRKKTNLAVLHVTATRPGTIAGVREVRAWHKARGWSDIGYHYIIRVDGTVEPGRPLDQIGAHVAGYNSRSIGIAHEGGLDKHGHPADTRTQAQKTACVELLDDLVEKYPDIKVCGHRDLSPDRDGDGFISPHEYLKECPCFNAMPWARANRFIPWNETSINTEAQIQEEFTDTLYEQRTAYLQKLLRASGYEFGPIDGITGPKTKAAVKRFQKAYKLPATGNFDDMTTARLRGLHEKAAMKTSQNVINKAKDLAQAKQDAAILHEKLKAAQKSTPAPPMPASTQERSLIGRFFHAILQLIIGK